MRKNHEIVACTSTTTAVLAVPTAAQRFVELANRRFIEIHCAVVFMGGNQRASCSR